MIFDVLMLKIIESFSLFENTKSPFVIVGPRIFAVKRVKREKNSYNE